MQPRDYPDNHLANKSSAQLTVLFPFAIILLCTPLAYIIPKMEFIETPTFTRMVTALLADDEYRELQNELVENPKRGDLVKGGGGIRKMRFASQGRGKSGGVRVIYYWITDNDQIYMLVVYPKSKKDTLSDKEVAILHDFVKEL